ncbi:hypothetical protein [Pelodictyon phaeoclathratiforme]|jgi:hypothetical protein|uniref:Glycosyltransferase 2-like domain-containing protein n=1 Tax=Pelodictyon phaeoclathratiforme (strain DSM 5477 / BU-1) TaxID=324925 RepID=B4SDC6_PELPB|nr:hypothetical protein [Pelodictyon phaeoclathratiforme]ACF42865.1 conserved hypothetical protein [Pelodictyon phaeoclathratiforme BU-1]MBV5326607.1 hypothetical protein [Chlorobium sp.]
MNNLCESGDFLGMNNLLGKNSVDSVRITFGMIVLNGEPFTRYNLLSLYPWAHQIIVVEGACRTAKAVATPDGHSIDGTLETLRCFQGGEDLEHKVILVSAYDEGYKDGFWPEKTEMCRAFARRATGNYLWQVDSDEFYRELDMENIIKLLEQGVGRITFPQHSFWGGIDYINKGIGLAIFDRGISGARVFAWGEGFQYKEHRPPTVVDKEGENVSLRGDVSSAIMTKKGIYRYHYCLVFPSQVFSKVNYYSVQSQEKTNQGGGFSSTILSWHELNFKQITHPFKLHNLPEHLSWIRPFRGIQPVQVVKMMADIRDGFISNELRQTVDINILLRSKYYRIATLVLDRIVILVMSPLCYPLFRIGMSVKYRLKNYSNKLYRKLIKY